MCAVAVRGSWFIFCQGGLVKSCHRAMFPPSIPNFEQTASFRKWCFAARNRLQATPKQGQRGEWLGLLQGALSLQDISTCNLHPAAIRLSRRNSIRPALCGIAGSTSWMF